MCCRKRTQRMATAAWNRANLERARATQRKIDLRRLYGITPEAYDEKFAAQDGVCAICKSECATGRRLAVDHDHETNAVRGLLCSRCNNGIGHFDDQLPLLEAAIEYLKSYK